MQFSVLINNTPTSFFSSSCGLRQEDPLPPPLFVIVIESLGRMIYVAMTRGLLFGFSV
jgi:hypothetical protein